MTGAWEFIPLTGQWVNEVSRIEALCFTDPWSAAGLRSDITAPCSHWYGILDRQRGRLAAFLGTHVIAGEAEIVSIATEPACRRQGLARALILEFLRLHPTLDRVFLEVRASNDGAAALYESLGFSRFGVRRGYYDKPKEDAILMRLEMGEQYADLGN